MQWGGVPDIYAMKANEIIRGEWSTRKNSLITNNNRGRACWTVVRDDWVISDFSRSCYYVSISTVLQALPRVVEDILEVRPIDDEGVPCDRPCDRKLRRRRGRRWLSWSISKTGRWNVGNPPPGVLMLMGD